MQALMDQARKLTMTSRAFRNDQLGLFYKEICKMTRSHKVLPMNSGAEAVETAIKTVRKWGYAVKGIPDDKAESIVGVRFLFKKSEIEKNQEANDGVQQTASSEHSGALTDEPV